jgi:hypothetical protein|nr:MAG TPA: hypothetical protein [Caudoviricetes sp.]
MLWRDQGISSRTIKTEDMQIRKSSQERNGQMEVLEVLEYAINQGLGNDKLDFFTKPKSITFKEYIGANDAEGYLGPNDIVPAGLFLYGRENFVNTPSAIFETDNSEVAFYELKGRVKRYIILECLSRKELTNALNSLEEEQVIVRIYHSLEGRELFTMQIYGLIPNSFAGDSFEASEEDMTVREMASLWKETYEEE